jgi:hypothetical protein
LPDFLLGKAAPAPQWNPHRAQVIPIDAAKIGAESLVRLDGRAAFYGEGGII